MKYNNGIITFFKDKQYRGLTLASVVILFNGTWVYHLVEKWSWLDSLYFSVITLTTVGYGDLAPVTPFGKIFTMFYVISGIGIIFGFVNALSQHRISTARKRIKQRRKEEPAD